MDSEYIMVPLFDKRLSGADLMAYGIIAHKAGKRGWFSACQNDLAALVHLHRATFNRSVKQLRECGYVRTMPVMKKDGAALRYIIPIAHRKIQEGAKTR
jgi:predicted transcriptional regulator